MIALAFVIELLFVIGFPLLVGAWIHRRLRISWLLFAAGAITFGLSQAVHLPLNYGIFALFDEPKAMPVWATALILGLTAGLCEESARYVAYRWVLRDVRNWREALMFGAGHGGIESIVFVGLMVGVMLLNMVVLQGADLESWTLPAGQMAQVQRQLDTYWGQAWTMPLLAALERLFSIIFHMGMAVLVLQAVIRRQLGYLLLAVALHTATDALAVITLNAGWSPIATEAVIGLFALVALGIILWFRAQDVPQAEAMHGSQVTLPALPAGPRRSPTSEERLRRQIEDSKYAD